MAKGTALVEKHALLWETMEAYCEGEAYPCHMPGHKRKWGKFALPFQNLMRLDLTEISGFDNLAHPQGILKEAEKRAASVFGSKETWFLVNGSTSGVLAAISACFSPGDGVLISSSSHLSVWRGIGLRGGVPVPVFPENTVGGSPRSMAMLPCDITGEERLFDPFALPGPGEVRAALEQHPGVKGMVLTAPTYEGALPEVKGIAEVLHASGKLLIVDGAHGAHFGFHPGLPPSAINQGADLVVQSLHKTLPALTQTALLHRCSDRVDPRIITRYVNTFQTSSPSYLLMASIDACVAFLEDSESREGFAAMLRLRQELDQSLKGLACLRIAGVEDFPGAVGLDPGKVVICTKSPLQPWGEASPGILVAERLRKLHQIETELTAPGYCLALMSVCDSLEGWKRLEEAICEADRFLSRSGGEGSGTQELPSRPAKDSTFKLPDLGSPALDYAAVYPPGIPFIAPGEVWNEKRLAYARNALDMGLDIVGLSD